TKTNLKERPPRVKLAKADIYSQASSIPAVKFEEQQLTSFAGLIVFQKLFERCRLRQRLHEACAHLEPRHYYSFSTILQCLIVHLFLSRFFGRTERRAPRWGGVRAATREERRGTQLVKSTGGASASC